MVYFGSNKKYFFNLWRPCWLTAYYKIWAKLFATRAWTNMCKYKKKSFVHVIFNVIYCALCNLDSYKNMFILRSKDPSKQVDLHFSCKVKYVLLHCTMYTRGIGYLTDWKKVKISSIPWPNEQIYGKFFWKNSKIRPPAASKI